MYASCRSPSNYKIANTESLNTYVCVHKCLYMVSYASSHTHTYTVHICVCLPLFVAHFRFNSRFILQHFALNFSHTNTHTYKCLYLPLHMHSHTHTCHNCMWLCLFVHLFAECKLSTVCKHSSQMVWNAIKGSCVLFFLFIFFVTCPLNLICIFMREALKIWTCVVCVWRGEKILQKCLVALSGWMRVVYCVHWWWLVAQMSYPFSYIRVSIYDFIHTCIIHTYDCISISAKYIHIYLDIFDKLREIS